MPYLVMTLLGADRPGLVGSVAEIVAGHEANWLESRMAHLAGQFAGILRVDVPENRLESLVNALKQLDQQGLRVIVQKDDALDGQVDVKVHRLKLVGADRPGIVREISKVLTDYQINVEEFQTECINAPMSGEKMFHANAILRLPLGLSLDELQAELEKISHDIIVDLMDS